MEWYHPSPPSAPIRPVPWLGMEARQYLDKIIQPEWTVAEHGGGGSTVWFASKCKHVTTVEANLKWFTKLAEKNLPNVTLIYGTDVPYFGEQLDLILIDGEPLIDRVKWIDASPRIVKPGGWVVLDNANRPEYAAQRKWMQASCLDFELFDCNGPHTDYLVTEFYRVPPCE